MKSPTQKTQQQTRVAIDSSVRAPDHWRINLQEEWEIRFWTREFGVTEGELRSAVEHAGDTAGKVRSHLAHRQ
jgi:hypothetical protein